MVSNTSRAVLVVMGAVGWVLACTFGVLACLLAADARGDEVAWQILGALVLGPMLASIPVGVTLFAAYRADAFQPPAELPRPVKPAPYPQGGERINWRWIAFAILCALELLLLPLTVIAAAADDDSLVISLPMNLVVVAAALLVVFVPNWKRASIALYVVHLVGIALALFCAAIEIETVIASGVLLSITGMALAFVGTRPRLARVLFASSTVVFIVISFLIIAIGEVRPNEADAPLFAAMVAYQILFVPVGLWALHRMMAGPKQAARLQFGLRQLLAAMVVVCIATGSAKLAYFVDSDFQIAVAVGLGALIVAGVVAVVAAAGRGKWAVETSRLQKTKVAY